jgi:hypothetical protein
MAVKFKAIEFNRDAIRLADDLIVQSVFVIADGNLGLSDDMRSDLGSDRRREDPSHEGRF